MELHLDPLPNLLEIPRQSRTLEYPSLVAVPRAEDGRSSLARGAADLCGCVGEVLLGAKRKRKWGWLVAAVLVQAGIIWLATMDWGRWK